MVTPKDKYSPRAISGYIIIIGIVLLLGEQELYNLILLFEETEVSRLFEPEYLGIGIICSYRLSTLRAYSFVVATENKAERHRRAFQYIALITSCE